MKPPKFDYFSPTSLDEALELLARHGPDVKVLAGGQSLIPVLNFRLARPETLIDLNRVDGLSFIEERGDHIAIGAMTRQRQIGTSDLVAAHAPLLFEATKLIGHLPTRTRGTIGGSLANADPAAEYPAVATALDCTMVVKGNSGERRVPAREFFVDLLTTAIEPAEVLTEIEVSKAPPGSGCAFQEIARRHGDFALAGVAAQLTVDGDRIAEVRLAACGVGPGPVRLEEAERIVLHEGVSDKAIDAAGRAAAAEVAPTTDGHASADYRRELTGVLAGRALRQAAERAAAGGPG